MKKLLDRFLTFESIIMMVTSLVVSTMWATYIKADVDNLKIQVAKYEGLPAAILVLNTNMENMRVTLNRMDDNLEKVRDNLNK